MRTVFQNMFLVAFSTNVLDFGKHGDCLWSSSSNSMKKSQGSMDKTQGIFFDVCGFKFSVCRSQACTDGVIFFLKEMYGRISWTLTRMLNEINS